MATYDSAKGDQPWDFFGRTDAKAETPGLWPPHVKSWLTGKDSDAGRDWGQEEKGTTEDETAGWHHWLDGRESQWAPWVGDGQGGLACCDSWGRKESDATERLNDWTDWLVRAQLSNQQEKWLFPMPYLPDRTDEQNGKGGGFQQQINSNSRGGRRIQVLQS